MIIKRIFDLFFSLILIILFSPLFIIIFILIFGETRKSVLHFSKRVGKNNEIFNMIKFKTMKENTPDVATHLLKNPEKYINKSGQFLRKTSLDELPQLFSIFIGKMSFVGPRPALFNQKDLIELRTKKGIHKILPGLTGYAQINGRDNLSIEEKVKFDEYYLYNRGYFLDLKIILFTIIRIFTNKDVHH